MFVFIADWGDFALFQADEKTLPCQEQAGSLQMWQNETFEGEK